MQFRSSTERDEMMPPAVHKLRNVAISPYLTPLAGFGQDFKDYNSLKRLKLKTDHSTSSYGQLLN